MNLLVLGPQGSGKGTQAARLSEAHGIPHVSTGEMFRAAIAADTELGRLSLPADPYVSLVAPGDSILYVTSNIGRVYGIRLVTGAIRDSIAGLANALAAGGPEAKRAFEAMMSMGKIDVATRRLVAKTKVGDGPIQVYISPDGKYLLAANQGSPDKPARTVSNIDTATFSVIDTVETGNGAHGVVIDPSSRHAYVTNIHGNDVAVLDLRDRKVVARIPVRAEPNGISFSTYVTQRIGPAEVELGIPHGGQGESMPGMGH